MSDNRAEISDNRAERKVLFMTAVIEASHLLKQLAEPWNVGDSIKAAINRAARKAGLSAARTEGLWRQEARLVRAEEMDAIRAAARQKAQEEEARAEFRDISILIERIEALEQAGRMGARDEDFHRPQVDALVASCGAPHRSLDRGER